MKKSFPFRLEKWNISFLIDKRSAAITGILLVLTFLVFLLSTGLGTKSISPAGVLKSLFGLGSQSDAVVIHQLRLPRVLVGMLVGASLAVAGAILQGIIRNPLASPDIIGITGGATVSAVAMLTLYPAVSIHWIPAAALAGAALLTLVIYLLAWKQGVSSTRLVLIGVGLGASMQALTTLVITTGNQFVTTKALVWITGSVYGSNWKHVLALLSWILLFIPLAFVFARAVNIQQLGDDLATGAGNPVQKHRFILLLICVALAGSAVAFGGAIGFVGLIAPHIARKLVGPSFGGLLPVSALTGGLIVMAADLFARTAFSPLDLPVGLFTSLIGAPFFIYLLLKSRNK